jgi:hypothetical protein
MKKLTQPQIALLIGFCLAMGIKVPQLVPLWDGTNTASFDAGKALVTLASVSQDRKRE